MLQVTNQNCLLLLCPTQVPPAERTVTKWASRTGSEWWNFWNSRRARDLLQNESDEHSCSFQVVTQLELEALSGWMQMILGNLAMRGNNLLFIQFGISPATLLSPLVCECGLEGGSPPNLRIGFGNLTSGGSLSYCETQRIHRSKKTTLWGEITLIRKRTRACRKPFSNYEADFVWRWSGVVSDKAGASMGFQSVAGCCPQTK